MALIKCPECGHEISNKSNQCIYCGFPLNSIKNTLYNIIFLGFPDFNTKHNNQVKLIACLKQILNIDNLSDAKYIIDHPPYTLIKSTTKEKADWIIATLEPFKCNLKIEESNEKEESSASSSVDKYMNNKESTVVCPRCGSNQITTSHRGFSFWTGFIGANKTVNRCANCGHHWTP